MTRLQNMNIIVSTDDDVKKAQYIKKGFKEIEETTAADAAAKAATDKAAADAAATDKSGTKK